MILLNFVDAANRRLQRILLVILLIQFHNNIRYRHYLLRPAIVDPRQSAWKNLYENADPTSFLHMTGLTCDAFRALLDYLFDVEDIIQCRRCGRPRSLGPDGYLGLLLFYLESTMNNEHLCLIFGITPSVCSRALNWMLQKTVQLLKNNPLAMVRFPSNEKMRAFANMVQR